MAYQAANFDWLIEAASKAGFGRDANLVVDEDIVSESTIVLDSSYAVAIAITINTTTSDSLQKIVDSCADWIHSYLLSCERNGRIIDGYLVLMIDSIQSDVKHAELARIALDTRTCRKVVLFGGKEESWDMQTSEFVDRVPFLLLPTPAGSSSTVIFPELQDDLLSLLSEFHNRSASTLAEQFVASLTSQGGSNADQ